MSSSRQIKNLKRNEKKNAQKSTSLENVIYYFYTFKIYLLLTNSKNNKKKVSQCYIMIT
jgi:hypothetical protein